VQSQAFDRSGQVLTTIEEMAAYYIQELRKTQPAGPYMVLGYSFGGIVAFEIAQQLHAAGEVASFVGLIDAPQRALLKHEPRYKKAIRLLKRAHADFPGALRYLRSRIGTAYMEWRHKIRSQRGRPSLQSLESAFDVNYFAAANYNPRVYPGRLVLFRAKDEESYDRDIWDHSLGWEPYAGAGMEVHELPGNHLDMFEGANVGLLAQLVENCIEAGLEVEAAASVLHQRARQR
jgi:thioesterase domain-containing protein